MNKADNYSARARRCMAMAAQAQHVQDRRQWLLMAQIWLDMIPDSQRTAVDHLGAALLNQRPNNVVRLSPALRPNQS